MDGVQRGQKQGLGDVRSEKVCPSAIDSARKASRSSDVAHEKSKGPRRQEVALLRGAADGNPDAIRTLIEQHLSAIHGFVRVSVGPTTTEDIMQETLIEAIRSAGSFRGESALTTWLHTIAKRRIFRQFGKERRQKEITERLSREVPDSETPVDHRDQLARALDKLSSSHRQAIVMKYLDDLSVTQIADALDKSRVQVQSLLQRARFALRAALAHEGI
jgi:RNA polymerase sigma factor (sigma-70 family)